MSKRLRLSPSAAGRWLSCTASQRLIADVGDALPEETSAYAEEGTRAHLEASRQLEHLVATGELPAPSSDGCAYVRSYVEFVASLYNRKKHDLLVEVEVPLFYAPEYVGTCDAALVSDDGQKLYIIDYKHGQGISVQAQENPQLAIYAYSLVEQYAVIYDITPETLVTIAIFQPRIRNEEPRRLWAMRVKELIEFCARIGKTASTIMEAEDTSTLKFAPSEAACRFCPVQAVCAARAEHLLEGTFGQGTTPATLGPAMEADPRLLKPEDVAAVLRHGRQLIKWVKTVEEVALRLLEEGTPVPDHKLVAARAHRRWADEEKVQRWLATRFQRDEFTTTRLASPAQVERLLRLAPVEAEAWAEFEDHVVHPEGAPTVAPLTDKRPPLQPLDVAEEFDAVD